MDSRLYTLYELIKNKSKKAYEFFKQHALADRHYERFKRAKICSKHTKVKFLDEYIVILTRYWSETLEEYYHGLYIVGIDDTTNKLFCHRLPWNEMFEQEDFMEKLNIDLLKELLGIRNGFERIQGDLTMKLEKADNDKLVEIASDIMVYEISFHINDYVYENIIRKVCEYTKDCKYSDRRCDICIKLKELYKKFPILKKYRIRRCYTVYNIKEKINKDVKAEIVKILKNNEELLFELLAKEEKIYKINAGNHNITLIGVRIFNNTYLLLREQDIEFKHSEHGNVSVPINKVPAIVEFGFLNQHPHAHARRP